MKEKQRFMLGTIAGILATVVCIYFRLLYGWDLDESYNILLAQRIADGKVILKDLWDLHQTAAVFSSFFCRLYTKIVGSTEGIAIWLRGQSIIIQILVAVFGYISLKKKYGKKIAFAVAVIIANFLPRGTQELEYSTVAVWGCLVCSFLFLQIGKQKQEYLKVIIAGIFYAAAVYAYPTMLITAPYICFLLIFILFDDRKIGLIHTLIFFLTCALLALGVLFYLLSNMSFGDLIAILHELGKNGDHTSWFGALFSADVLLKSLVRVGAMIAAALVIKYAIRLIFKLDVATVFVYVTITTFLVIGLNITGLRPSGPFGLLERYIGAVLIMLFDWLRFKDKSTEDKKILWILGGMGIAVYVGALMGSNLGINENAMYLESSLICLVILSLRRLGNLGEKEAIFGRIAIWCFVFGMVFTSGYFIRVDGTRPANVTECRDVMTNGPLKGIRVSPEKKQEYDRLCTSVDSITEEGKLYTLLTREPIMYYYVNGDYISAQYAATAQYYNEQWIDFYELFDHGKPDFFLVNKLLYPDLNELYEKEFGKWLESKYEVDNQKTDDTNWVLTQK